MKCLLNKHTGKQKRHWNFESPNQEKSCLDIGLDSNWMVGSTKLEIYISTSNATEEINKVEIHLDSSRDEFLFVDLKDKASEVLRLPDFTPEEMQHVKHVPDIIKTKKNYR